MPARSESAGLAIVAWTQQRAALLVDAVVDGGDRAGDRVLGRVGDRRRRQSAPTLTAAAKRSGTQKSTRIAGAVVERGDRRLAGDVVACLDRQDADDAGDRRDDGAAVAGQVRASRTYKFGDCAEPASASVDCDRGRRVRLAQRYAALSSLAAASSRASLARSSAISSVSESSVAMTWPLSIWAPEATRNSVRRPDV